LLDVQQQAEAERARTEAELDRQALAASVYARDEQTKAEGDAGARRLLGEAQADAESRRQAAW
jgi:hypothetical protein